MPTDEAHVENALRPCPIPLDVGFQVIEPWFQMSIPNDDRITEKRAHFDQAIIRGQRAAAELLEAARVEQGLSYSDLATSTGIESGTLQGWLTGMSGPHSGTRQSFDKLVATLGVTDKPGTPGGVHAEDWWNALRARDDYVFLSYVSEDRQAARRLAEGLRSFGIDVWFDHDALAPGDRWQTQIHEAIANGQAFIACFSSRSETRDRSYMRAEITAAVEELRLRPTSAAWFIPVLLDGTSIADDRRIGGGSTLSDIQYVDMSMGWDQGVQSVVAALVGQHSPEKRAQLQNKVGIAQALERLAVADSMLVQSPLEALNALDHAARVPVTRSSNFFDRIASLLGGVSSIHELHETPNMFGATNLPANPVALSNSPTFVVWSNRAGAVGVAPAMKSGVPTVLAAGHGTGAADVFINSNGTVIVANYFTERVMLRWDRVGDNRWIPTENTDGTDWADLLPHSTTRYGVIDGNLVSVGTEHGRGAFVEGVTSELKVEVPFKLVQVAINHDASMIVGVNGGVVRIGIRIGDRFVVAHEFDANTIYQNVPLVTSMSLNPNGIKVDRSGGVMFHFWSDSVYVGDPLGPVNRETVKQVFGRYAVKLPHGAQIVSLSGHLRQQFDATDVRLSSLTGMGEVVARKGTSSNGIVSISSNSNRQHLAISDERGRVYAYDLDHLGPVGGGRPIGITTGPRKLCASQPGTLVSERDDGSLLVCKLDGQELLGSYVIQSTQLPSTRIVDIELSGNWLLVTHYGEGGLFRAVHKRSSYLGEFGSPISILEQSGEMKLKINSLRPVRLHSSGHAAWRNGAAAVGLFELGAEPRMIAEFPIPHNRGSAWDFDLQRGLFFLFSSADAVRVFSISTKQEIHRLVDTGGGSGSGAFGDMVGDIRVVGDSLFATKMSGSIGRWSLGNLESIGRPLLVSAHSALGRIEILRLNPNSGPDLILGAAENAGMLMRRSTDSAPGMNILSGLGTLVGSLGQDVVCTVHPDGSLRGWDLSSGSIGDWVHALSANSSSINLQSLDRGIDLNEIDQ